MGRQLATLAVLLLVAAVCAQNGEPVTVDDRAASTLSTASTNNAAAPGSFIGFVPGQRTLVGALLDWANLTNALGEASSECGLSVQHKYNCSESACEDLVPGA